MDYTTYTAAIEAVLNEVNRSNGLDLELHPGWAYPILDARKISLGYKFHRRTGPTRTMSLAIDTFTGFEQLTDGTKKVTPMTKIKIVDAIESFWLEGQSERHIFVEV